MQKHASCSCKTLFMHSRVQPRSCLPVLSFRSSLLLSCAVSQRQRVPAARGTSTSHLWVAWCRAPGRRRILPVNRVGRCHSPLFLQMLLHLFPCIHFPCLFSSRRLSCFSSALFFIFVYFFGPVWSSRLSPEFAVRWNSPSYSLPLLCSFLPSTISQPFPALLAKNQNKAHPKLVEEAGALLSVLQVPPFGALYCYFHRQSSVIRGSSQHRKTTWWQGKVSLFLYFFFGIFLFATEGQFSYQPLSPTRSYSSVLQSWVWDPAR